MVSRATPESYRYHIERCERAKAADGDGTTVAGLKAQSDRIYRRAYPTNSTASHSRVIML